MKLYIYNNVQKCKLYIILNNQIILIYYFACQMTLVVYSEIRYFGYFWIYTLTCFIGCVYMSILCSIYFLFFLQITYTY